jgi:hypothetical protein
MLGRKAHNRERFMVDKPQSTDKTADETIATATPAGSAVVTPPRRPGHRGADVRDTVAEMAARAQEISLEAGSKIAAAMKDVIGAAAGLTGFAVESARDLVQYMVRRGQMTQDEADKLIREVEESQGPRKAAVPRPQPRPEIVRAEPSRGDSSDGKKQAAASAPPVQRAPVSRPAAKPAQRAPARKATSKPAKKTPAKRASRPKAATRKGTAKAKKKR